ncbi:MAG: hypothetical protein JSS89_12185 [Bacteroidetes bacterium]|nr:hypothetical protein [Bacteroidota bacterium]
MYDYATYNSGGEAPGTKELWKIIKGSWPRSEFLGIYNVRSIRGSDRLSLHSEGRAVDFHPGSAADRDAIASWALRNADKLGVQEVIVYETKRIWTSDKAGEGWRPYKGVSSPYHHIHIGQHRQGAGLTGSGYDPRVMAQAAADALRSAGVRLWHIAFLFSSVAIITAGERGTLKRLAQRLRSDVHTTKDRR